MLNMLRTHITKQDWKNALDVIDKWTEKNAQYRKIVYSKNQVIDSVIDGVLGAELAKETLRLQLKGKILKEIKIDDLDLCLMLSNLLENAKEAVLQLELNKRNIDLKIDIREDFAVFDIRNPYNPDEKIEKKEEGWHGYGLKNVEEIVKKYNGKLNITTEATMFCVSVILENVCK